MDRTEHVKKKRQLPLGFKLRSGVERVLNVKAGIGRGVVLHPSLSGAKQL